MIETWGLPLSLISDPQFPNGEIYISLIISYILPEKKPRGGAQSKEAISLKTKVLNIYLDLQQVEWEKKISCI